MKTNLETMQELLADQLGQDNKDVKPESRLIEDLGADSLDTLEIIMAVEEEWNVTIDEDEAEKVITVQDAVTLLEKTIANEKAQP